MPEAEFERAFSDLAHASLRDKAPGLMDYLVGFQLIDKNDDETHAVGVFGFKVGDQWLYAPMFFMGGRLKGSELLYVKSQDMFVPLKDNWVNYLLSKQPYILGTTEPATESELRAAGPDFSPFSDSIRSGKWAAVRVMPWAEPFMPVLDRLLTGSVKYAGLDLRNVVRSRPELLPPLLNTMRTNIKFAESVLKFYKPAEVMPAPGEYWVCSACGHTTEAVPADNKCPECGAEDGVTKVVKMVPPVSKQAAATDKVEPKVEIIDGYDMDDTITQSTDLTDAEKQQLARGELVIRDHRKNTSKVYTADVHKKFVNPMESGYYQVLMSDGSLKNMLVFTKLIAPCKSRITGYTMVVDPDTARSALVNTNNVFVNSEESGTKVGLDLVREQFERAAPLSSMTANNSYIAFNATGTAMVPIEVIMAFSGQTGLVEYRVKPKTTRNTDEPMVSNRQGRSQSGLDIPYTCEDIDLSYDDFKKKYKMDKYDYETAKTLVVNPDEQAKFVAVDDSSAVIPNSFRVLKLKSDLTPLKLGNWERLFSIMSKQAQTLSVCNSGPEITVDVDGVRRTMNKRAAFKHFLIDWSMDQLDAEQIIKEATSKWTHYFVKSAVPKPELQATAPDAPAFGQDMPVAATSLVSGVPVVEQPEPQFITVDSLDRGDNRQHYRLLDDPDVQQALTAASKGKKDIFDLSVVSGLVKTMDVSEQIDSMLPDMIKGMDRVGRMLFIFYWHNDAFKERYGRQDLLELEDSLQNMFSGMGDLVLFLKQKTIQANPALDALDINLGTED